MAATMTKTPSVSASVITGDFFAGACLGALFIERQSNRIDSMKQVSNQ
jgi:hypothetical protein